MGLFKKKQGGTFVGNLIRKVANQATGGILGNGVNKWQLNETEEQYKARVGGQIPQAAGAAVVAAVEQASNPSTDQGTTTENLKQGAKTQWLKNISFLAIPFALCAGLIIYLFRTMPTKKKIQNRRW